MKPDNNLVGVLIMCKNEQDSISVTINSVKNYIKHVKEMGGEKPPKNPLFF